MSFQSVTVGQLTAADTVEHKITGLPSGGRVTIKAMKANVGNLGIGPTGLAAGTWFELGPGEAITLDAFNLGTLFYRLASANDKLCWIGQQ